METVRRTTRIRPGMLVVYKLHIQEARESVGHKLLPRFSTPWRVVRQLDNSVTYEIRNIERSETKLINRDRLAIYTPNRGQYNLYEAQELRRPFVDPAREETTVETAENQAVDETAVPSTHSQVMAPPPPRQLRTTVERRSRAGDPMSWQYDAAGATNP